MKVYRGLSVCSVENKIAGRIDEGDIRSMGFRKNSIRRKTRENKKSLGIFSHYVKVLIFWLIDPVSQSYLFRFHAGGVVIPCKSIDGQQEIGDISS